jgi:chromate transporter
VVGVIGKLALWFAPHTCFTDTTIWHRWPLHLDLPSGRVVWPSVIMIALLTAARWWRVRSGLVLLAMGLALGLGWMTLVLGAGLR